jgi:formamidopyrimidine-DNA glycosylase
MPELPDVTVYVEALRARIIGARFERLRLVNPFVLRSVDPPIADVTGRAVTDVRRLGKRIVIALEDERFVVIHLMIAGRLHWKAAGARPPAKIGVAAFDFTSVKLVL